MLDLNVILELIQTLALLTVIIFCTKISISLLTVIISCTKIAIYYSKISIYYFKKIMLGVNFSEQNPKKVTPKKVTPKKKNNLVGFDMSNENYYDKKRNRRIL